MRLGPTARLLLAVPALALSPAAAPAAHAQVAAVAVLPADLPPSLAVRSVDDLPITPQLPALSQPAAAPLLGLPGPDRLSVRSALGGVLLGQEGGDRLVGGAGPDHLDGGTGADEAIGNGGAD
ncbi:MAG: hypothetical protein QOF26_2458 [Baekduia sp.]|nr:hypothetical protein [Baekduia sp.]